MYTWAVPMAVPLAVAINGGMLKAMPMAAPIGCAYYIFLNLPDL